MTLGASGAAGPSTTDPRLARELRRYLLIGKSVGALVLLLSVALVVNGVSTGTRPVMFVFFGLILAQVGIVFIRFFQRPSTRQKWIQRKCPPRHMLLLLNHDASKNIHTALLFEDEGTASGDEPEFILGIHPPDGHVMQARAVKENTRVECSTYFDPESGQPVVIESGDAVHWRKD